MTTTFDTPRAAAFDGIADCYDDIFTNSLIGRAQRKMVWKELDEVFRLGDTVLELNCGTGEDALHLAERGVNVVGCDASERMVNIARQKRRLNNNGAFAQFRVLPTEDLTALKRHGLFDGVFSNFAGLNCVADLHDVARHLAEVLSPGSPVVLCVYGKFCIWEMLFYGLKGRFKRAFRRWRSVQAAQVGDAEVLVHYRSVRELQKAFSPLFKLRRLTGVGMFVPPSYMEHWVKEHRVIFRRLVKLDHRLSRCPGLRVCGDHILLTFERISA